MAMKGSSAFPKAPALLEPHYQIVCVISTPLIRGFLPVSRGAVGVFFGTSQLDNLCSSPLKYVLYDITLFLQHVFVFLGFFSRQDLNRLTESVFRLLLLDFVQNSKKLPLSSSNLSFSPSMPSMFTRCKNTLVLTRLRVWLTEKVRFWIFDWLTTFCQ